jgi:hypothetical protein
MYGALLQGPSKTPVGEAIQARSSPFRCPDWPGSGEFMLVESIVIAS